MTTYRDRNHTPVLLSRRRSSDSASLTNLSCRRAVHREGSTLKRGLDVKGVRPTEAIILRPSPCVK